MAEKKRSTGARGKATKEKKTAKGETAYASVKRTAKVKEPSTGYSSRLSATVTSRIRAVGNSKGVILNSQLMNAAGISADADIVISAEKGKIIIEAKQTDVNTDLSTWDQQFRKAIKAGAQPENDLFEGMENEFDKNEWK